MYILREGYFAYIRYVRESDIEKRNGKLIGALYKFRLTADERSTAIDPEEI